MKTYRITPNTVTILMLVFLASGCFLVPDPDINENIEISNDEQSLSKRIKGRDREIEVDSTEGTNAKAVISTAKSRFSLRLIAEVSTPTVGKITTQATMVSILSGSPKAVVSYNERGAGYTGAIDVLQLPSGNSSNLRIRSGVTFSDADVNAVYISDNHLWAAHSSNNPKLVNEGEFGASRQFALSGFNITPNSITEKSLPGFAANCIMEQGNHVFVTSGSNAGLTIFDITMKEQQAYFSIPDARWVDADDRYIVVLTGGEGTLRIYDRTTFDFLNSYPFPGADTPEAKNTVEIVGNLALVAAGASGTHIMDLTNGTILATVPIPDPGKLGLSPDVVESNAASADEEFIFIANGEAGVYVAVASANLNSYQSGQPLTVELLGQLKFDDLESANHVSFRDRNLIIATGLGGIKAVRLTI